MAAAPDRGAWRLLRSEREPFVRGPGEPFLQVLRVLFECSLVAHFSRRVINLMSRKKENCRTTRASTAPCSSRRMCCPTHCASYCAPFQPLLRAFSGWIHRRAHPHKQDSSFRGWTLPPSLPPSSSPSVSPSLSPTLSLSGCTWHWMWSVDAAKEQAISVLCHHRGPEVGPPHAL